MTTIAIKNGLVSFDSLSFNDQTGKIDVRFNPLQEVGDFLFIHCGNAGHGHVLSYLNTMISRHIEKNEIEDLHHHYGFDFIAMDKRTGKIYSSDSETNHLFEVKSEYYATGAAKDICDVVLHLGKSTEKALQTAMQLSAFCGGIITTLSLYDFISKKDEPIAEESEEVTKDERNYSLSEVAKIFDVSDPNDLLSFLIKHKFVSKVANRFFCAKKALNDGLCMYNDNKEILITENGLFSLHDLYNKINEGNN